MNIEELREERSALQATIDYCPPENASNTRLDIAIRAGDKASDRLDDLAPTFALLDAIDELMVRLNQLESTVTCAGCRQAVAWTCPHCGFGNAGAPGIEGEDWDGLGPAERDFFGRDELGRPLVEDCPF